MKIIVLVWIFIASMLRLTLSRTTRKNCAELVRH